MQLLFSGSIPGSEEPRGVAAVLGILDLRSGEVVHMCEYQTPAELRAPKQKMQFTGYSLTDGRLYACCHNEIVRFDDWPPAKPAAHITNPSFNDLHHCIPWNGGLAVANTGLETVDHVSEDGELLARWDLLAGVEGARTIDPEVEYRRFEDQKLKPHVVHGNHLFVRRGELWVTQLRSSRAVRVTGEPEEILLEAGMPHDGRSINGLLTFTTTNGHVVVADPNALEVVASHDLVGMTPDADALGWCRGVCEDPRGPDRFFVAFSIPRETSWRDYVFWVKHQHKPLPSRIASYDVARRRLVDSFVVTPAQNLFLFQLDLVPQALWV